jgi:hypothetical protein
MTTQVLELENLDARLGAAIHRPDRGPVLLTENGKPVYIVRELDDDDLADELLEHDPGFLESIRRARQHIAEGKGITLAEARAKYAAQNDE